MSRKVKKEVDSNTKETLAMKLPKDKEVDRLVYTENLFIELRMLNDKLRGLKYFYASENQDKINENRNLLDAISYLYYESIIVQLTWLFGFDVSSSQVSLPVHLNYLLETPDVLNDFADKHIDKSETEREKKKKELASKFSRKIEEFNKQIDCSSSPKKKIKLARHNLFAHKSKLAFNHLSPEVAGATEIKEVWENFAPDVDDIFELGDLAIDIGAFIYYVEKNGSFPFHESSILIDLVNALDKTE